MERHFGPQLYVAIPVAAVTEPGSCEDLVAVDYNPDRGALGASVCSDRLDINFKLAVELSQSLGVEPRRRGLLGQYRASRPFMSPRPSVEAALLHAPSLATLIVSRGCLRSPTWPRPKTCPTSWVMVGSISSWL